MNTAAAFLAVLSLLVSLLSTSTSHAASASGSLLIVATFPSLVEDIRQVACSGDRVVSIVPSGADPHDYNLRPEDVELLRLADLIVSTKHVSFEYEIGDLASKGLIRAHLVEVPEVPGISVRKNPATGAPNYHMPIYDPLNYAAFIKYIVERLSALNPACSSAYRSKGEAIINRVMNIYAKTPRLEVDAVIDYSHIQYAVDWVGLRIKHVIVREHGLEVAPDLAEIERAIDDGLVSVAVVMEPIASDHSAWLYNRAIERGLLILRVHSPLLNNTIVEKLEHVYDQVIRAVERINRSGADTQLESSAERIDEHSGRELRAAAFAAGLLVLALTIYTVIKRERS